MNLLAKDGFCTHAIKLVISNYFSFSGFGSLSIWALVSDNVSYVVENFKVTISSWGLGIINFAARL